MEKLVVEAPDVMEKAIEQVEAPLTDLTEGQDASSKSMETMFREL